MAGGPVTRLLMRLKRSKSLKTMSTAVGQESARKVVRGSSALASGIVLDDATLDALAAVAANGDGPARLEEPEAFRRFRRD
jgi:hypothetical protein